MQERQTVMVCGDLHNLGDLKLLLQNLRVDGPALVRRWRDLPPAIEQQVSMAGGTLIDARDLFAFARHCWGANLVIGGGQLVRDNQSPRSLIGLLAGALAARAGGGRVVTRGLGVSRINTRSAQFFWSRILGLADRIRVRDAGSASHAAMLVGSDKVIENADMVFLCFDPAHAGSGSADHRNTVVVAPCVDAGEKRFLPPDLLDHLIRAGLSAIPDARLVLACHDPQPGMDLAAARNIAGRLADASAEILCDYDLAALEGAYKAAGLVITNRLHSVIFSLLNGAAVIIIDDGNPKLQAVATRFGLPIVADGGSADVTALVASAMTVDHATRLAMLSEDKARAQANIAKAEPRP